VTVPGTMQAPRPSADSARRVRLGIVHTVPSLIPTFRGLADELLPDVDVFNIVDESLLRQAIADLGVTPSLARRVTRQLEAAQDAGADLILVSCSSIGPGADAGRALVSVPVVRVDEAMARRAVELGSRIAVLATLHSTLAPTVDLIRTVAADAGAEPSVTATVVAGAYACAVAGDPDGHDRLVREALIDAARGADVVVLAQASMARAAAGLPDDSLGVPVLTSPRLAVEQLARLIPQLAPAAG
jgi:Asp/Glu/hydantoin racemase